MSASAGSPYTAAIPEGAGFWRQSCAERGGGCWDSPKAWRDWTPGSSPAIFVNPIRHVSVEVWTFDLYGSRVPESGVKRSPLCGELARTSRTKMFDEDLPALEDGQALCADCAALMEMTTEWTL